MKHLFYPLGLTLLLCQNALASLPTLPQVAQDTPCSLSLGTQEVNYGRQTRYQLTDAGGGQLSPGKRELLLGVVCPYSQPMKLALRGDRALDGALRWGEHGSVRLRLYDARLDGQPVALLQEQSGQSSESLLLRPGEPFSAVQNGNVVEGKTFTAQLEIVPLLPESASRVALQTDNEARLTLELLR
ncbi:hypothetical protein ACK08B_17490 [Pantoea dispersa]|uniref:hypothetical protein n=1 Tax=Pantoea dispersa TaxID=59814 RepID=UPI00398944F8